MTPTLKLALPPVGSACLTSIRIISLLIAVASGVWMNHESEIVKTGLTEQIAIAHKISGIVFIISAIYHVWLNRQRYKAIIIQHDSWKLHADQRIWQLNTALFLCVVISAITIGCGNLSAIAFHSGCGLLIGVVGIFHFSLGRKR